MSLTDIEVKQAQPSDKIRRLYDERGMYLEVSPSGSKWFRFKYRFQHKEKRLALGVYPEISLKTARALRDEARQSLSAGIDPAANRKAQKGVSAGQSINSFEVVAREWITKNEGTWAESHTKRVKRLLERDVFPWIGGKSVADVKAMDVLAVARRIEARGARETAHRAKDNCGQVFRFAIATGRADRDPTPDLRGALQAAKGGHFAATTEPKEIGEILRAMDGYKGSLIVRCALRLMPLVFVRPGELRQAEWSGINLEEAVWRYTVTKTNTPHIVPLSRQAVLILRELHPLTWRGRFVFPGGRSSARPMSENAVLAAMRSLGIDKSKMSGHGFRAVARTLLDEVLGVRPDYIEHQLAHAVRDPNGRAYNRTAHLEERRRMMQVWADYLDGLKTSVCMAP